MKDASTKEKTAGERARDAIGSAIRFPSDFLLGRKVEGRPLIHSADTAGVGGTFFQIKGIKAPYISKAMTDESGEAIPIGQLAANRLRELIGGKHITTRLENEHAPYDVTAATLICDGKDVAAQLVSEGWAVADGKKYAALEEHARNQKSGLWAYMPKGREERTERDYNEYRWHLLDYSTDSDRRFSSKIERESLPGREGKSDPEIFAVRGAEIIGFSHSRSDHINGWIRKDGEISYFSANGEAAKAIEATGNGVVNFAGRTDRAGNLVVMKICPQKTNEAGRTETTKARDAER